MHYDKMDLRGDEKITDIVIEPLGDDDAATLEFGITFKCAEYSRELISAVRDALEERIRADFLSSDVEGWFRRPELELIQKGPPREFRATISFERDVTDEEWAEVTTAAKARVKLRQYRRARIAVGLLVYTFAMFGISKLFAHLGYSQVERVFTLLLVLSPIIASGLLCRWLRRYVFLMLILVPFQVSFFFHARCAWSFV